MSQHDEQIQTINLEPIGGRKVSVGELENTAKNIIDELKNLGKNGSGDTPEPKPQPPFDTSKLKTYGLYAGGGLAAIYLIGKALE